MKKLIKKSFHRKEKGFTLIELLIVIVIIGILAGVLIAVINPVRQQNRARNATVRASILKVAFAVNSVRAGIGTLPSNDEIDIELENMTPNATNCAASATTLNCAFNLSGTTMPQYCETANDTNPIATGTQFCNMRLVSVGDNTYGSLLNGQFRVVGAKFDLDTANPERHLYIFDSTQGLLECGGGYVYAGVPYTEITVNEAAVISNTNCHVVSE